MYRLADVFVDGNKKPLITIGVPDEGEARYSLANLNSPLMLCWMVKIYGPNTLAEARLTGGTLNP